MASRILKTFRKVRTILPHKKKLEDYYEVKHVIGSGSSSIVHLGIRKKTGEEVAIKIINKLDIPEEQRDSLHNEIDCLNRGNHHANIIQLRDVFEDRRRLVLVLELMSGGHLLEHIQKRKWYSEKEAGVLMRKIMEGVAYLHKNGVVHRDLKPENLLFSNRTDELVIKIADFGFARYVPGDGTMTSICGTPAFLAPEIAKEQHYNKSVDIWSLGVVLYIMLSGFPPFSAQTEERLFALICEGKVEFPDVCWRKVSSLAKDFVTRLLTVEPAKRLTAEQALRHPWLVGMNTGDQSEKEKEKEKEKEILCKASPDQNRRGKTILEKIRESSNHIKRSIIEDHNLKQEERMAGDRGCDRSIQSSKSDQSFSSFSVDEE
eukprot:TRINITY_DN2544_c0_g1_i1.p1 TRINITY_DN2544_c0_g1~~TRINITY_DN2544_c0_g1_i1.p1  ORF type:complete len:375 (-),score=122.20 TRINITY_DN2544_c0_g1_i1:39-1163(-)